MRWLLRIGKIKSVADQLADAMDDKDVGEADDAPAAKRVGQAAARKFLLAVETTMKQVVAKVLSKVKKEADAVRPADLPDAGEGPKGSEDKTPATDKKK
ncbi:hypothetical protein [Borrelia sp. RT1S]|uniref:hypothetical protein n=1 Tax=Borrelia sp. RT1S TaxID=2898580 RepID=UPI00279543AB|nr:hypothetical protein [Borrelia sp. RT1S]